MEGAQQELLRQLREAFAEETAERIATMQSALAQIKTQGSKKEWIEILYRDMHSLKGAARAVGIEHYAQLCQHAESVLSRLRKEPQKGTDEVWSHMLATLDCMIRLSQDPEKVPDELAGLERRLQQLAHTMDDRVAQEPTPAPAPAPRPPTPALPPVATAPVESLPVGPAPVVNSVAATETGAPALTAGAGSVRIRTADIDQLLRDTGELSMGLSAFASHKQELSALRTHLHTALRAAMAVGEITVGADLQRLVQECDGLYKQFDRARREMARQVDVVQEHVRSAAIQPFSTLYDGIPPMVRSLAKSLGKQVELECLGKDIHMDRRVLDQLKDPLLHLLRNSLDHGLEAPETRIKAGKPAVGKLVVALAQIDAATVSIEISDDGAGIDWDKVTAKARHKGLPADVSPKELIFYSGFSSSDIVTDVSGRGLGLAIVLEKVQSLGGKVTVESELARGTVFALQVPVSASSFRGVALKIANEAFVLPQKAVEQFSRIRKGQLLQCEGHPGIGWRGATLLLQDAARLLQLPVAATEDEEWIHYVIIRQGQQRAAFRIDRVLGSDRFVLKTLGSQFVRVPFVSACVFRGDGKVLPVLHPGDLMAASRSGSGVSRLAELQPAQKEARRVLVVDDSITSRTLIKNVLLAAGYTVDTAEDGISGYSKLCDQHFDALLSDVEMPHMDGFELTRKVRANSRVEELPVILITSLASPSDKQKGADAGADAYVVKGDFNQSNLLQILEDLLP